MLTASCKIIDVTAYADSYGITSTLLQSDNLSSDVSRVESFHAKGPQAKVPQLKITSKGSQAKHPSRKTPHESSQAKIIKVKFPNREFSAKNPTRIIPNGSS